MRNPSGETSNARGFTSLVLLAAAVQDRQTGGLPGRQPAGEVHGVEPALVSALVAPGRAVPGPTGHDQGAILREAVHRRGQPAEGMMLGVRGMTGVPLALLAHIDEHGPDAQQLLGVAGTDARDGGASRTTSTARSWSTFRVGQGHSSEHTHRGILFPSRNKPPGVSVDLAGTPLIES